MSPGSESASAAAADPLRPWVVLFVALAVFQLLTLVVAGLLIPEADLAAGKIGAVEGALAQAVGQLAVIGLGLALRKDLGRGSWSWWVALPAYGLLFFPWNGITSTYLGLLADRGVEVEAQAAVQELHELSAGSAGFWVLVVAAVILAPLAEEVFFRGFLRDALMQLGTPVACVGSSLLFGLVHGVVFAFPLALFGLFLFWLRHRSGGLWAPILAHAVHNAIAIAFVSFGSDLLPVQPK